MPPEWAPHIACYLAWPHNRDTWPDKFDVIPPIYADMVAKIVALRAVRLAVTDEKQIDEVREMILDAARRTEKDTPGPLLPIDIFHLPTNDAWVRDHGPIFVNRLATAAVRRPKSDRARLALQLVGRKVRRLRSRRRRPAESLGAATASK